MKIALLIKSYQPVPYELGQVNACLLEQELIKLGHQVSLIYLSKPDYFIRSLFKRFNVIYASGADRKTFIWFLIFALFEFKPLYVSFFDNTLEPITQNKLGKLIFLLLVKIRLLVPFSVSNFQQRYLRQTTGVKTAVLYPVTKIALKQSPLPKENILLFVGSTNDYKRGLDTVIKALPIIAGKIAGLKLVVVNKYQCYKNSDPLKKLARRLNVSGAVVWKSGVLDMQSEYRKSKMLLLPYASFKYCPPVPFSIIETLSYGRSAISTDFGSISEILPARLIITPGDYQTLAKLILAEIKCPSKIKLSEGYFPGNIAKRFVSLTCG